MPDEGTPAPEETPEDTPEAPEETVDETTPSEEPTPPADNYEQRYNDLRPEYDRSQQFLAALQGRQGPDAQQRAYEELGLEIVGDEDTEDDLPPDPDERIEQLEQWKAEREEREEQERFEHLEAEHLKGERAEVEKKEDRELTSEEWDVIESYALRNRHDDGRPDVEGGHAKLQAIYSNARDRLLKPKKNSARPGKGTAGVAIDDLSTPEGRRAAILDEVGGRTSD